MSINKLVSIKNAVLDAQDMLGLDNDALRPLFTTWATYAEKEIGGQGVIRKFAVIDICGCTAQLPCDVKKMRGAILGEHDPNCGSIFSNRIGGSINFSSDVGNQFIVVDAGSINETTNCGMVPYEIQDNKMVFNYDVNETKMTIMYDGYASDCDGFIKIGENHVAAISEYIQYMYWKRKRNKDNQEVNSMNMAYREWDRLCAHARALDAELTESDREEIAQLYNDPYAGRGLYTGMTTNNQYGWFNY